MEQRSESVVVASQIQSQIQKYLAQPSGAERRAQRDRVIYKLAVRVPERLCAEELRGVTEGCRARGTGRQRVGQLTIRRQYGTR